LNITFDENEKINNSLSGCADLNVKLGTENLSNVKLGCFKLGNSVMFNSQTKMSLFAGRTEQTYFYDEMSYLNRSRKEYINSERKNFELKKLAYIRRSV